MQVLTLDAGHQRVSLQDLGRKSNAQLGVPTSGAADEHAYLAANSLLNNPLNAPALEIMLGAVKFSVLANCLISYTGLSDLIVNGRSVAPWQVIHLNKGDTLEVPSMQHGVYAYLAIEGGFEATTWLDSCAPFKTPSPAIFSTSAATSAALCDSAQIATPANHKNSQQYQHFYAQQHLVARFIPNNAWSALSISQQQDVLSTSYTVDNTSSKMGYRINAQSSLENIVASAHQTCGQLSKPVASGQIQLPSANQWIILMKDCQTMGGYPTIGSVMKTDINRIAQLKPGQTVSFTPISVELAQLQLTAFYQKFTDSIS